MSGSTGKQHDGTAHEDLEDQSLKICIEIGLSAMDKLHVPIDNTTTVRDLKCKIEFLSGIPSDLFELDHNGSDLTESLVPMMSKFEGLRRLGIVKMKILPVWERFISTCLKAENSQVRARIRVKMHGVTKEERIFVACFVAARQGNSCLLFGILPSNKMITRTVRLSGRNILHAAVIGGKTNCIANILMHGGGKLMNIEDCHSQTPLSMARTLSKGDIVDMLEAYKMVSLRGERSLKGTNYDDDSGYECIITSQGLEETKESNEQDSEEDYELSPDEEEEETQNARGESDETSSSFSTDRHFLDEFAGHDESAATSNDVTTRFDGSSEKLLIEQIKNNEENGSKEYEMKTTYNKDSWISGNSKQAKENITYLSEQGDEDNYLVTLRASPGVCCEERADYSKTAKTMDVKKRELEKEYEEEILVGNVFKNNDNGMFPKKEQEKGHHFPPSNGYASLKNNDNIMFSIKGQEKMSEISTKIDWKTNKNRGEDVGMVTDKCTNNDSIEWVSDDLGNPTKRRSHTLNGKMIFKSDEPQATAVLNEVKQPGNTVNTGNPLIEDQPVPIAKSGENLLLRRRKKGMPSLVVSRTSRGLSSSLETLSLLDSMGKNIDNDIDNTAVNNSEESYVNSTDNKQVCTPPTIKGPWIPKPPSNPIPIAKTMQQMRRKLSTGSPTSGSPKVNSKSDMEGYLDEAWRRASDSDVNESLPVPLTRPRSYSTPHPPDPFDISKPMTSSELKTFKILNAPATNNTNRRQSVGGWGRRNSISLTYDEWLETKKEQHRRNSLAVQKEKQRRLTLGNQSTLRLSRCINYEQWLAMKTSVTERKSSQDLTNNCHGNERSREESERAFKTWLEKKDEEALDRELRLLDEAISRRTSDTKKEDILSQLTSKMECKKSSGH